MKQRTPVCFLVVPGCWQGESSLSVWEGSWKCQCQDLGGLLQAWVTAEAALGKRSLLFPSLPTLPPVAAPPCHSLPPPCHAESEMPHGYCPQRGAGGKAGDGRSWPDRSWEPSPLCSPPLVPAKLVGKPRSLSSQPLSGRAGEISAAIPAGQNLCMTRGVIRLQCYVVFA